MVGIFAGLFATAILGVELMLWSPTPVPGFALGFPALGGSAGAASHIVYRGDRR
jgi:hypothetical protein